MTVLWRFKQTLPPLPKRHMIFERFLTANFAGFIEMCNVELEKRKTLGTVDKRRPQSGRRLDAYVRTFRRKKLKIFFIMVCPYGQGGGGQFFAILSGRLSWTAPCLFDFLPLHLLLVRSHQVDKIIVKRLYIQGRNNVYDDVDESRLS